MIRRLRIWIGLALLALASVAIPQAQPGGNAYVPGTVVAPLSVTTTTQAANTSADGINLINSTPATNGNQEYSPRERFCGNGYGTTGSASQPTCWIIENQPQQGTTPTTKLVISYNNNGGAYTPVVTLNSNGTGNSVWAGSLAITGTTLTQGALNTSFGVTSVGTVYTIASGTGACATTSTKVGGALAGNFTCTGTTGASTVTLTLNAQGSTGVVCFGRDVTTPTTVTQTGAISLTSVTLTMTSVAANDVIQFACPLAY